MDSIYNLLAKAFHRKLHDFTKITKIFLVYDIIDWIPLQKLCS